MMGESAVKSQHKQKITESNIRHLKKAGVYNVRNVQSINTKTIRMIQMIKDMTDGLGLNSKSLCRLHFPFFLQKTVGSLKKIVLRQPF